MIRPKPKVPSLRLYVMKISVYRRISWYEVKAILSCFAQNSQSVQKLIEGFNISFLFRLQCKVDLKSLTDKPNKEIFDKIIAKIFMGDR